jgi:WD40 repeat protein
MYLISSRSDYAINIWCAHSYELLAVLSGHSDIINELAFPRLCFSRFGSASADCTARVWDIHEGSRAEIAKIKLEGSVISLCFNSSGEKCCLLVQTSIKLWDYASNQILSKIPTTVSIIARVTFSVNDEAIISSRMIQQAPEEADAENIGDNNELKFLVTMWDASKNHQVIKSARKHKAYVSSVAVSPLGDCIASGSFDESVIVWEYPSLGERLKLKVDSWVISVRFSEDGTKLAAATTDRVFRVWDPSDGQLLLKIGDISDRVNSMCFSGANILICGILDVGTCVYDTTTGELRKKLCDQDDGRCVAHSSSTVILM